MEKEITESWFAFYIDNEKSAPIKRFKTIIEKLGGLPVRFLKESEFNKLNGFFSVSKEGIPTCIAKCICIPK